MILVCAEPAKQHQCNLDIVAVEPLRGPRQWATFEVVSTNSMNREQLHPQIYQAYNNFGDAARTDSRRALLRSGSEAALITQERTLDSNPTAVETYTVLGH